MITLQKLKNLILGSVVLLVLSAFEIAPYSHMEYGYISAESGLDTDECNFTYQDSEGYLWIGSNEGLYRYDGYEILNVDDLVKESSLSKVRFFDAIEGGSQTIWFATSKGVLSYNKKAHQFRFLQAPEDADFHLNQGFNSIAIDRDENIWFGGLQGLYKLNTQNDSVSKCLGTWGNGEKNLSIKDIEVNNEGDVWVATWGQGVGCFDKEKQLFDLYRIFKKGPVKSKYNVLTSIHFDSKDNLWLGTWDNGLYVLDINDKRNPIILNHFAREAKKNTIIGNIVYDIEEDENGGMWIGTPYGVSVLKDWATSSPHFYNITASTKRNALNNNEIRGIFKDQTGLMYLSTQGGGVNKVKITDQFFKTFNISQVDSLKKSQSVYSFIKDPQNRLLVGVQSLAFGVYDVEKQLFKHYTSIPEYRPLQNLNINTVKSFAWDKNGVLWLGTRYRGLVKYDTNSQQYYSISNDFDNDAYSLKELGKIVIDDNNTIWLISEGDLYRVDQGKSQRFDDFEVKKVPVLLSNEEHAGTPVDFELGKDGVIYLAMSNGKILQSKVGIYTQNAHFQFEELYDYGNEKLVKALYIDDKNLWIGGENGLTQLALDKEGTVVSTYLTQYRKLKINSILKTEEHIVGLSNKGVLILALDENENPVNILSEEEGLQGNIFIGGALYQDGDQTYVGGHSGFNILDVKRIEMDNSVPKIALTNIRSADKEYFSSSDFTTERPFVVSYADNAITLSFAAIDLRNPEGLYYAYKLEGLDNEWAYTTASNRTATYINLEPGEYVFKVKATNALGKWTGEQSVLPIFVETAPYLTWWAYLFYVVLAAVVLYCFFILYKRQARAKEDLRIQSVEKSKSEKLNQFKLQFFTNLSHELLTPLSVLMIIAQKWRFTVSKDAEKEVKILNSNVNKLHEHIKQMLHFRKAETGNMTLNLQEMSFGDLASDLLENYQVMANDKELLLKVDIQGDLNGKFDREKLEMCTNNLLSNAIKYTPKGGEVTFSATSQMKEEREYLLVVVSDTGRGIPKENLENIFNRFFRLRSVNQFEDGLGIGLALTQHLITLQGGEIGVESTEGKGASFRFMVPVDGVMTGENTAIDKITFTEEEELHWKSYTDRKKANPITDIKYSGKTILIVEDNPDFLLLMETYLSLYYKVLTAENGKKAFELASSNEIDLIVSDLMVPDMDGFELCSKIKSDVNTSHIPFIIVTARTEDRDRLIGYEVGADSYLTKPINFEVLIYRMESLLKTREKMHADFNTGAILEPKKLTNSSIDETFIVKAKEVVEENMSEPDFTVKVLCDELGMSNSMFYRKIKGILDLTPNEFIKNIRLRRAAQLLEGREMNISDIAYMTGFNDLSYFGVCFKKQYGKSPSNYQKEYSEASTAG
ncbi:hypothetical protein DN752_22550 [Echinicola strongylocentroti]|uniref:histidine kinase n=1 Tax=Echinicola strongylocentroti TaxID=1795355 RepID=A0A2Z4IPL1_9BACT|nr:hybrid sensor histidine kinase/response regulator transcription factor [Echinicola strongylocentroti]AWW32700.1 hypothetical protein DN752_22550 [Echinicola strongylocentroti]